MVVRPIGDYLKGAELAIKDELLTDLKQGVIRTARKPDGIWREAQRNLKRIRATKDLDAEDKSLARSYWWLAKFNRDYPGEFYAKIIQGTERKEMTEEKKRFIEIVLDSSISALSGVAEAVEAEAKELKNIRENHDITRSKLAELVEEKFGLQVRTCVNCRYYRYAHDVPTEVSGVSKQIYHCLKSYRPVGKGDSCMGNMLNGIMNCWKTK